MEVEATLIELAEEHLARMAKVSWSEYAAAIRKRAPGNAGDTFGCEVEGVYFDVGDIERWAKKAGGDVLLTAFATTGNDAGTSRTVERTLVIAKPSGT
jgi:hypothetical protein